MPGDPQVTLVMPVWQPRPDWLHEAVRSALDQTGCDLEVVVVDDGNDVPVATVLADVDDPRLRIVRIPHGGTSAARNAGTAAVRTPYVRFVDADDVLVPDGTAKLLAHAGPDRIVHGRTLVCDDELRPSYEVGCETEGDASIECLLGRFEMRHVSMLLPTDVARAAGPWDPTIRVCQDRDFVQRCVELVPVVAIPDVLTLYRRHPASATRREGSRPAAWHGQRRVVEKYFERHPDALGTALEREAWTAFHTSWARRALRERDAKGFLREVVALARRDRSSAAGVVGGAASRVSRRLLPGRRRSA